MGFGLILIEVRSPMLFSVGMYLPLETTFAIFVGGLFRWFTDKLRDRRDFNDAHKKLASKMPGCLLHPA